MDNRKQIDKQPAEMGENSDASVNVKSITNIYYDCLERIFEFLDLRSLLNVANTCKRLQIAAAAFYGDVYGKRTVSIEKSPHFSAIGPYYNKIVIRRLERCLPFLQCFGPKILHLQVFFDLHANDGNDYVHPYVNQYCAKTLQSILFYSPRIFSIADFPNPFECVEKVSMVNVELKGQLPNLVKIFPKLRRLGMMGVTVDENGTDVHFPNLEQLTFDFGFPESGKNLLDFLHANSQLQEFTLRTNDLAGITVSELLNIISQNPSITKLHSCSWNQIDTNINPVDLMRFASKRPHTVELDLPGNRILPQDAINFIRQLKSLETLRFSFNDQADYDQLVSQLDREWKHEHEITFVGEHFIILKR